MAHWNSEKGVIVTWPSQAVDGRPGWVREDCGCCNGISWGGFTPQTCPRCRGNGVIYRHLQSGVLALYVGGPMVGRVKGTPQ